jgi:hypothetical protein
MAPLTKGSSIMGYVVLGALVSLGAGSVLIGIAKDRLRKKGGAR